jgi:5S rRNA maturation endonuclease (ribonuclease M5)
MIQSRSQPHYVFSFSDWDREDYDVTRSLRQYLERRACKIDYSAKTRSVQDVDQNSSKVEVSDVVPIPKLEGLVNTKPYQLKR